MSATPVEVHPLGALMRRFAVDWLDRADPEVPPAIMAPDYTITIAGVTMTGRDAYLEATTGQLARFPGLVITVHDAFYTEDGYAALRFTEHGASARGGLAAWRGIGLFRARDGVLAFNACEEDYLGRRRQLQGGDADAVDPPMVAPWTAPVVAADADAEVTVRAWLERGGPVGGEPGLVADDGREVGPLLEVDECAVDTVITSGRRVAFHGLQRGHYAGGLPDLDEVGAPVEVGVAGFVDVAPDGSLSGHVVRDRLGVHRSLTR